MIDDVVALLRRSREVTPVDPQSGRFRVRYDMASAFGDDESGDPRVVDLVLTPDRLTEYLADLDRRMPDPAEGSAAEQHEARVRFFCGELLELMDSDLTGTLRVVHLERSPEGDLYPEGVRGPARRDRSVGADVEEPYWSADRPGEPR